MRTVHVKKIKQKFNFVQLAGGKASLDRVITAAELNRPGFELCGFYHRTRATRIIILGQKEMAYIKQLDHEVLVSRFDFILNVETPAIIIASGLSCPPLLKQMADARGIPVLGTPYKTGRIFIDLIGYLDTALADSTVMHGVFLNIYGKGVAITGASGIGKSEIALELIKKGHLLIVDDSIELYRVRQHIIGRSPELIKNMLEIRGIGVIDAVKMFGVSSVLEENNVDFVVHLEPWSKDKSYARLGTEVDQTYQRILGINIPKIILPVSSGRNISAIIEAAVMNLRLKENGIDSSKEFIKRIHDSIQAQGETK